MRLRHLTVALLAVGSGLFAATAAGAQGNDADFCLDTPPGTPVNTHNCATTTKPPGTTSTTQPGLSASRPYVTVCIQGHTTQVHEGDTNAAGQPYVKGPCPPDSVTATPRFTG